MAADESKNPAWGNSVARATCPTETQMWTSELCYLSDSDPPVRVAQFVVRTAIKAGALARSAGTDPIDELLDARTFAASENARRIYERAIGFLRIDQVLSR